jgi:hypothetical protein
MPRDLSDRYTGRRGYFRTPDRLRWWKYALAVVAFGCAVAWAAVDVVKPPGAAYAHTHGPLTNPHAAFDTNCAACHVAHAAGDFSPAALFDTRARWHDLTCDKCHAGAPHHASVTAEGRQFHDRCSNCHHDHNGRLNSLVRIADTHCTGCHGNLTKWNEPNKSPSGTMYENEVTDFAKEKGHPKFRSLTLDERPRTLTFSHALHMNPGQAYSPDGKEAMTVGKLRKLAGDAAAARYAPGAADDAKVRLDCASCHQLDPGRGTKEFDALKAQLDAAGEPTKSLLPPRPEGAYFLPVNFDVSCRSCHPLAATEGTFAGKVLPRFEVPHRKQPADLLGDLKAGYLKALIATDNPALAVRPEPGGRLDGEPEAGARKLSEEVTRLAEAARKELLSGGGCAKCHKTTGADPLRIEPVPDRTVWLTHAKFNHAAHRGATCATCHPNTGGAPIAKADADKPEPVQIEGVESCRACHAPLGTKVTLPDKSVVSGGGVRHGCTDCHRYHHGDQPLQGRGGESWFPKEPRDLADWLKGN